MPDVRHELRGRRVEVREEIGERLVPDVDVAVHEHPPKVSRARIRDLDCSSVSSSRRHPRRTRSLDRAMDVLVAVAESRGRGLGLRARARRPAIPGPPSAARCGRCSTRGLVAETGRRLGRRSRAVPAGPAGAIRGAPWSRRHGRPLRRLRDRTGESALLGDRRTAGPRWRSSPSSTHRITSASSAGSAPTCPCTPRRPASSCSRSSARRSVERGSPRRGPLASRAKTIVDVAGIERELARARRRGWAEIVDELEVGLVSLSAPDPRPHGNPRRDDRHQRAEHPARAEPPQESGPARARSSCRGRARTLARRVTPERYSRSMTMPSRARIGGGRSGGLRSRARSSSNSSLRSERSGS